MAINDMNIMNISENAHDLDTMLGEPIDPESNSLTDLDRMLLPARPLAEGTDVDSSNTFREQLTASGSGRWSVQYHWFEEEAGGNITSGTNTTRADTTAADIPQQRMLWA